jgi:hypothetical protein
MIRSYTSFPPFASIGVVGTAKICFFSLEDGAMCFSLVSTYKSTPRYNPEYHLDIFRAVRTSSLIQSVSQLVQRGDAQTDDDSEVSKR